MRLEYIW